MARMYSRDKGRAGSKKPIRKSVPSWIRYEPNEIEMLILKLAKEGHSQSKIGLILKDMYGIPDVKLVTKSSISNILKKNKLLSEFPEDLTALMRRSIVLMKHLEKNNGDKTAKRGLQLTESKVKRLIKYYKRIKKLPADFKYDPEKVGLLVK